MQAMFLRAWLLTLAITISACAAATEERANVRISNQPEDSARGIYVGADSDMPVGHEFKLAIQPTRDAAGEITAPTSLRSMLREMHQMLPRWYLNALAASKGDNECSVIVNDIGYSNLVSSWIWITWGLESESSPLRKEFANFGVPEGSERVIMTSSIESGFCELVKTGDENKALQEIVSYGKFK